MAWRLSRGLSPRVRGNHPQRNPAAAVPRSIPACAGEPVDTSGSVRTYTVYPRVCGGTTTMPVGAEVLSYLSPRVRGNHVLPDAGLKRYRSIPACAGEPTDVI